MTCDDVIRVLYVYTRTDYGVAVLLQLTETCRCYMISNIRIVVVCAEKQLVV